MPDRGKSGLWETKDESFASQTDQPAYYQRIFLGPQQSCLHIFNNTLWNTMQTAYPAVQAGYHFSPAVCCHHFGLLFFLSLWASICKVKMLMAIDEWIVNYFGDSCESWWGRARWVGDPCCWWMTTMLFHQWREWVLQTHVGFCSRNRHI